MDPEGLRNETTTVINVADFRTLPFNASAHLKPGFGYTVPEQSLAGQLSLSTADSPSPSLQGTYVLTPAMASSLSAIISSEVEEVPPEEARVALLNNYPGMKIIGTSSNLVDNTRRLPTVYNPFRAGRKFVIMEDFFLMMSNLTFHVPNATYANFSKSGMLNFFDIGSGSQVCIMDSILVLKSCEGFPEEQQHILCCTGGSCIDYTEAFIRGTGFPVPYSLDPLSCFQLESVALHATVPAPHAQQSSRALLSTLEIVLVALAGVILAAISALSLLWAGCRKTSESKGAWEEGSRMLVSYAEIQRAIAQGQQPPPGLSSLSVCDLGLTSDSRPGGEHSTGGAHRAATPSSQRKLEDPVHRLEDALDALRDSGEPFMGKYAVLGAVERRQGGQGIVQFASQPRSAGQFALKFFMDETAYRREMELYSTPALRAVMPCIYEACSNSEAALTAPNNYPFPPVIVLDRGEGLDEFAARMEHEPITIVQALVLVVKRVQQLHAAGWVHRDLKPGNILRMPQSHSWTLIDFGCAAATGSMAQHQFTANYAAPEVLAAAQGGRACVEALEATDIWAVGVVAYELLTKQSAFPKGTPKEEVMALMSGGVALPWECAGTPELKKLMRLKGAILQCLDREPGRRPTAAQLAAALDAIFREQTTSSRLI